MCSLALTRPASRGCPAYLDWATRALREGGTLIADNVFRRAAVPVPDDDPANAEGIKRFNSALAASPHFRVTWLPLEDGFAVAVRI